VSLKQTRPEALRIILPPGNTSHPSLCIDFSFLPYPIHRNFTAPTVQAPPPPPATVPSRVRPSRRPRSPAQPSDWRHSQLAHPATRRGVGEEVGERTGGTRRRASWSKAEGLIAEGVNAAVRWDRRDSRGLGGRMRCRWNRAG
jgi:hypothetical protein